MPDMIPIERLDHNRHHFPGLHLQLVLDSITAGNTAAHLWHIPQTDGLVLWDKGNNVLYIAGTGHTPAAVQALAELIAGQIAPQARAEGAATFKTRALSAALEDELPHIFSGITLRPYPTHFYTYASATPPAAVPPTLADLRIIPLDQATLAHNLAHSEEVRAEIRWMWPSEELFYTRGFGTLALVRDQIICWCTAEYAGPTYCGIGIATIPAYERQGVATATAAAFVQAAQQRGLTACWECGHANTASVRVAEKVGFVQQAEELYWVGSFTG